MPFQLPTRYLLWAKTLVAGVISGACHALIASSGAAVLGSALNWKQIGSVAASGAFVSGITYLAKSPLPPDKDGDTDFYTKPDPKDKPIYPKQ